MAQIAKNSRYCLFATTALVAAIFYATSAQAGWRWVPCSTRAPTTSVTSAPTTNAASTAAPAPISGETRTSARRPGTSVPVSGATGTEVLRPGTSVPVSGVPSTPASITGGSAATGRSSAGIEPTAPISGETRVSTGPSSGPGTSLPPSGSPVTPGSSVTTERVSTPASVTGPSATGRSSAGTEPTVLLSGATGTDVLRSGTSTPVSGGPVTPGSSAGSSGTTAASGATGTSAPVSGATRTSLGSSATRTVSGTPATPGSTTGRASGAGTPGLATSLPVSGAPVSPGSSVTTERVSTPASVTGPSATGRSSAGTEPTVLLSGATGTDVLRSGTSTPVSGGPVTPGSITGPSATTSPASTAMSTPLTVVGKVCESLWSGSYSCDEYSDGSHGNCEKVDSCPGATSGTTPPIGTSAPYPATPGPTLIRTEASARPPASSEAAVTLPGATGTEILRPGTSVPVSNASATALSATTSPASTAMTTPLAVVGKVCESLWSGSYSCDEYSDGSRGNCEKVDSCPGAASTTVSTAPSTALATTSPPTTPNYDCRQIPIICSAGYICDQSDGECKPDPNAKKCDRPGTLICVGSDSYATCDSNGIQGPAIPCASNHKCEDHNGEAGCVQVQGPGQACQCEPMSDGVLALLCGAPASGGSPRPTWRGSPCPDGYSCVNTGSDTAECRPN